jgi:hypothetical protein
MVAIITNCIIRFVIIGSPWGLAPTDWFFQIEGLEPSPSLPAARAARNYARCAVRSTFLVIGPTN